MAVTPARRPDPGHWRMPARHPRPLFISRNSFEEPCMFWSIWKPRTATLSGALVAMAVLAMGCSHGAELAPGASAAAPPAPAQSAPASDSTPLVKGLPDFTALVERYGNAVVNVSVVEKSRPVFNNGDDENSQSEDPLRDFLRRFGM